MRVFTKLDGKLACWQIEVENSDYADAIKMVRDALYASLGAAHKPAILALVKY